jgi:hypothetical protein
MIKMDLSYKGSAFSNAGSLQKGRKLNVDYKIMLAFAMLMTVVLSFPRTTKWGEQTCSSCNFKYTLL